jgi:hypothetical protein
MSDTVERFAEEMQARIRALEAERDRLREAARELAEAAEPLSRYALDDDTPMYVDESKLRKSCVALAAALAKFKEATR